MRTCFPIYLVVRLCAILLFMSGMVMTLIPAEKLLLIRPMNWAQSFAASNSRVKKRIKQISGEEKPEKVQPDTLHAESGAELNEYIEKKSKGRKIRVSGAAWAELLNGLSGLPSINGYFSPELALFSEINSMINDHSRFFYVFIDGSADNTATLAVEVQKSEEFIFHAPLQMAFPFMNKGLWLLLVSIIIYLAQTSGAFGKNRFQLNSDYLGRGSDLLAAIMVSLMITVGSLIAANISYPAFSQGWLMAVGSFTAFSGFFAAIWLFTAYYRTLAIDYRDHRVIMGHLFGSTEMDTALIREVKQAEHVNPGWMKKLLKLGRLASRSKGEARYYQDRVESGFCIVLSTGQTSPTMKYHNMTGLSEFFAHLEKAGVEIETRAKRIAEKQDNNQESHVYQTGKLAKLVASVIIFGLAYGIVFTFPTDGPELKEIKVPEKIEIIERNN